MYAVHLDMSDAEKLSRRSFEPFQSGVDIAGGSKASADFKRGVDVTYEVIYFRSFATDLKGTMTCTGMRSRNIRRYAT